jgi:hypothetical protein
MGLTEGEGRSCQVLSELVWAERGEQTVLSARGAGQSTS